MKGCLVFLVCLGLLSPSFSHLDRLRPPPALAQLGDFDGLIDGILDEVSSSEEDPQENADSVATLSKLMVSYRRNLVTKTENSPKCFNLMVDLTIRALPEPLPHLINSVLYERKLEKIVDVIIELAKMNKDDWEDTFNRWVDSLPKPELKAAFQKAKEDPLNFTKWFQAFEALKEYVENCPKDDQLQSGEEGKPVQTVSIKCLQNFIDLTIKSLPEPLPYLINRALRERNLYLIGEIIVEFAKLSRDDWDETFQRFQDTQPTPELKEAFKAAFEDPLNFTKWVKAFLEVKKYIEDCPDDKKNATINLKQILDQLNHSPKCLLNFIQICIHAFPEPLPYLINRMIDERNLQYFPKIIIELLKLTNQERLESIERFVARLPNSEMQKAFQDAFDDILNFIKWTKAFHLVTVYIEDCPDDSVQQSGRKCESCQQN